MAGESYTYIAWTEGTNHKAYTLNVFADRKSFESFALIGTDGVTYPGVIKDKQITINIPNAYAIGNMKALFTTDDAQSVTINGINQVSGETNNNFVAGVPVTYTLCANENNCNEYAVTVNHQWLSFIKLMDIGKYNGKQLYANQIEITSDGKFAYAISQSPTYGIISYKIATDGTLTTTNMQPLKYASSMAISRDNDFLSVIANNQLLVYSINHSSGSLTLEATVTKDGSAFLKELIISPDNQIIYFIDNLNNLLAYKLDNSGATWKLELKYQLQVAQVSPYLTISNDGQFIYLISDDGFTAYVVNQSSLAISQIDFQSLTIFNIKIASENIAYITTTDSKLQGQINIYQRSPITGALTGPIQSLATKDIPTEMAISPSGTALYLINFIDPLNPKAYGSVSVFSINSNGTIVYSKDEKGNNLISTHGVPSSIRTSPNGKYVYALNSQNHTIALFSVTE
jgi:6-phosphogluconolactonase (cycloisomerase 2 family)